MSVIKEGDSWPLSTALSSGILPKGIDVVEKIYQSNLWLDDANLRFLVRRFMEARNNDDNFFVFNDDQLQRELTAEETTFLEEAGRLIGSTIARNATVIDQNPPVLVQYSRTGELINKIVHCPEGLERFDESFGMGFC
jgi:hypothetical protein